jgi:hypothetical protein
MTMVIALFFGRNVVAGYPVSCPELIHDPSIKRVQRADIADLIDTAITRGLMMRV